MQCPSSVMEGGLVAQATFSGCRTPDNDLGVPYCEYRDYLGRDYIPDNITPGDRRVKSAKVTIDATTGGTWTILTSGTDLHISGPYGHAGAQRFTVNAGESKTVTLDVFGRGNWRVGSNAGGQAILVAPPGAQNTNDAISGCAVTVTDDDGQSYYIGQRNAHPYGESWPSQYYCTTPGCAWQ